MEIDELKKLSPKERIAKLKELQKKNKEAIEKATKLLTRAEEESEQEDRLRDISIPQLESVDIESLFTQEERELFKTKRFEEIKIEEVKEPKREKGLESIAEEAPRLSQEEQQHQIDYMQQAAQRSTQQRYDAAKEIYSDWKEKGYLTQEQQEKFKGVVYENEATFSAIEQGRYTEASQEVAREMVLIEKMKHAVQYKR